MQPPPRQSPAPVQGTPNPVDVHVGARVRMRRKALRLSQQALADALGLTFQQVQKYEHGTNRISASKLHAIALILKSPVSDFFAGLTDPEPGPVKTPEPDIAGLAAFLATEGAIDLMQHFPSIRRAVVRRRLVALAQALAGVEG